MSDLHESFKKLSEVLKQQAEVSEKHSETASEPMDHAWSGDALALRRIAGHIDTLLAEHEGSLWWDDPELDGTDFAHPAWWRGERSGVKATAEHLLNEWHKGGEERLMKRLNELATQEQDSD